MTQYLLGLDAGNTMSKAVLFDLEGRELGSARRRNPIEFPGPNQTERNPETMWRNVSDAIRELLAATATDPADIAAISVSGYGAGLYLVDKQGQVVRPGIMSTDSRASAQLARWDRDGVAQRAGLRVQQRLWLGQPAALMRWLSEFEPRAVKAAHTLYFCKDYLRTRLCGDISTDITDAGLAGLMDIPAQTYPDAFYEELGLAEWREKLPKVGSSTEIVGTLSAQAAADSGLKIGTPVVRGLVDVCAATVASGVGELNQLCIIAGTFSINSTLHRAPRLDTLPLLQLPYPIGGYYLASEASPTSASNFEWYCKSILGPEAAASAASQGRSIYEVCGERVGQVMNRPNDILFMPFLFGGPAGAPAGFVGLKAEHDGGDVARAIFEGIVFAHKLDLDTLLAGNDKASVDSIRLAGGAMCSPVWSQMFADVLGMPVEVTEGSEVGARGTAMCAAVALGAYPDMAAAMRGMVRVQRVFQPDRSRYEGYARKYRAFRSAIRALTAAQDEFAASEAAVPSSLRQLAA